MSVNTDDNGPPVPPSHETNLSQYRPDLFTFDPVTVPTTGHKSTSLYTGSSNGSPVKAPLHKGSGSSEEEELESSAIRTRPTMKDVFACQPKTVKDRWQLFLYNKGLSSQMPEYMKEVYLQVHRKIFVNCSPSEDLVNSHGHPLWQYPRNKIRTTKYTPISFFPKNILFQFTNIANTYFLFVIILGAFLVFGVALPGLQAVPLVVIVVVTAVKDAFEDYRRGRSDDDLNNSAIHLLNGFHNGNVLTEEILGWRKFKKACTRGTNKTGRGLKKAAIMVFGKKYQKQDFLRRQQEEEELALRRISTVISEEERHLHVPGPFGRISNVGGGGRISQSEGRTSNISSKPAQWFPNTLTNPTVEPSKTKFKNRHWKDIHVGDIIRIRNNEEVPADVVLLSSSDPEGNCYVETRNLDGELNLKSKLALRCGEEAHLNNVSNLGNLKFWLECDAPNGLLYLFKGTIHYERYSQNGDLENNDEREVITTNNLMLRGLVVRNTAWTIGVVVYTGSETKIMINSGITPTKRLRISSELNLSVVINFVVLFILCFISGLVNGLFYNQQYNLRRYFDFHPYGLNNASRGVIAFFVTLIIYQSLVPISLYISVEIIKTLQAFFIFQDVKMYYEKLDFPCLPKLWNISDDLGQIEYVFSDKTGTLTQNVMEFKKCTIGGKSYGLAYTEAKQGLDRRNGLDPLQESEKWHKRIALDRQEMIDGLTSYSNSNQIRENLITFCLSDYVKDTIVPNSIDKVQKEANETFMLTLALCHTVVTEANPWDHELRDFKAESPDEAALVSVARDVGFALKQKVKDDIILSVYGEERRYKVHSAIAFTSTRKRMSNIVETPEGRFYLLTKGADNVIFQRLDKSATDDEVIKKTALHLEEFANEGLRTLCIARRELDGKYVSDWLARFRRANELIEENREELIDALGDEIERDLILLGGTAIEDRLQDGVPDSILLLAQAGIKLWVLTGDRVETAINIGFLCNLLENNMQLLVINPDEDQVLDPRYVDDLLTSHLNTVYPELQGDASPEVIEKMIKTAIKDHSTPSDKYALIISGSALSVIFDEERPDREEICRKLVLLGKVCKSVLCCRVSPAQKAAVVNIVKTELKVMTLAIGDGANDVAMIQAANVGVGIAGEEGRQAVMSLDYAIGQFRFLVRLLLVHGRWSYKRLAEMVPCFFYKNVVFTLTCFWFGIYNNFDGSYLYEYTFLMFYNLAFTSLPVIFLGVLDQDVSDTVSLLVPQLYRSGILRQEWLQDKFVWYMLDGLYQSVISFYFPYLIFYTGFNNPKGLVLHHRFWMGTVVACLSVTACNIYVMLKQYRWDWLSLLINAISILLVYFWTGVWSVRVYSAQEYFKCGAQVFGTLLCWCAIFIGILLCVLPRFMIDTLKRYFKPRDVDIIREQVRAGVYEVYPDGYDPTDKKDVEAHRFGTDVEPEKLAVENGDLEAASEKPEGNPVSRTFKSIKRLASVKTPKEKKNKNLAELRREMLQSGELNSLSRILTTHELPGLTQAETLMSYHTRQSIQIEPPRS